MKYEVLFHELDHDAEMIKILITGFTTEELRLKPNAESWSGLEVICHLYDEEREDFRQRLEILLYHPERSWPPIDPTGWVTVRKYNDRDPDEMLEKFLAERKHSLIWLQNLKNPNWDSEVMSPFGFAMKAGDMLSSWVAHDNLHMRQLVELRRSRIVVITEPYDIQYAGDW
jgi:hypothetical protein